MSNIQLFDNGEFELRITPVGDSFTVAAPGLARALGHRHANHMLANIPEEEKGYRPDGTPGGNQVVSFVTEAGFYRVIGQRQPARVRDTSARAGHPLPELGVSRCAAGPPSSWSLPARRPGDRGRVRRPDHPDLG